MVRILSPMEDAYGQELWAHYNGKRGFEVVERDDGYFDVSFGPELYFSNYEQWSRMEKEAVKFVKGRVLDIGCGAGRHSLYLQEKGFDVFGIDNSPLAIRVCKLRGLRKAEVMPIEELSFPHNSFDTVLLLGGNFGLFGNPKKARRLLRRLHKITSKEAIIVAETRDPYKTENPAHLEYHELNRKRGRMPGQTRIRIRFQKYATKWFDYLLVSKEEMKQILEGTGWKAKQFIESENTPNYITIIEKTKCAHRG